jgi:pre-mRNA-processing factor 19
VKIQYNCSILCTTVSNEVPEHPVISPVSGCIYERRLLEKYLLENGTDPMTGEKLTTDMLIDVKSKTKQHLIWIYYLNNG